MLTIADALVVAFVVLWFALVLILIFTAFVDFFERWRK